MSTNIEHELSDALIISERRRCEAQRLSGVGFWELNHKQVTLYWSEEIFAIYELEANSIEPNYEIFKSLIYDDDRELVDAAYRDSVESRTEYNIRYRVKAGDSTKWIEARGVTYYDQDGKPERSIGTAQDISEIIDAHNQLIRVFNCIEDVIYVADPVTYELLFINDAFEQQWGGKAIGQKCYKVLQKLDSPCEFCTNPMIFGENASERYEWEFQNKVNHRWYSIVDRAINWHDGRKVRFEHARDITEQRLSEEKIRQAATVFSSTAEGIIITDIDAKILDVNQAFCDITGYKREEVIGQNPRILQSGEHEADFYQSMWKSLRDSGSWSGEIWNRGKSGKIYPALLSISAVKDHQHNTTGYVAASSDITSIKKSQQRLDHLAHHDALTGLPNRLLFNERLEQSIGRASRHKESLAILFVDLDRFKNVNDSLGHRHGDELLKQVSKRLRVRLRTEDSLARISGDEFIILLERIASGDSVAVAVNKILASFDEPFLVLGSEIRMTSSIGISIYPNDAANATDLLSKADAAMYRAKDEGRNTYQFFKAEMTNTAFEHVVIENALQKALKNDEFFLVYQPQYRLKDRSYIGMEVLLRWNHPDLGLVPPSRFISIAEQSGQIRMIGEWVLSKACQQGRDWLDQGYNFHRMAINISGLQLQQRDFLESFQKHLRASGLPAHYIELEITETFLMKSTQHAIDALKVIKEQGCHVSIDDFGTGYSSMAYLKKLPVTNLKVDQSFVQELPEDQDDAAITRAIIALAHALNLKVIAEGIETEAQLQFLVDIDCNYGQGYLFNKPLTVDQMTSLLSTERA